jgi:hypothetical protein
MVCSRFSASPLCARGFWGMGPSATCGSSKASTVDPAAQHKCARTSRKQNQRVANRGIPTRPVKAQQAFGAVCLKWVRCRVAAFVFLASSTGVYVARARCLSNAMRNWR